MHFDMSDLIPVTPEIFLLSAACVILVLDLFLEDSQRIVYLRIDAAQPAGDAPAHPAGRRARCRGRFLGHFVRDPLADALKVTIYIVAGIAFLYAKDYLRERGLFKGEYYVLGLFAVLGMMIMVSANGFLTVYLGLELLSLSLYALVASDRDSKLASEAAMKYFVLGSMASGMLLYGVSMIYGATGSIEFQAVADGLHHNRNGKPDPGIRPRLPGHRAGIQVGRRTLSHVGAGCIPRCSHAGDLVYRHCSEGCRVRHGPAHIGVWVG